MDYFIVFMLGALIGIAVPLAALVIMTKNAEKAKKERRNKWRNI